MLNLVVHKTKQPLGFVRLITE